MTSEWRAGLWSKVFTTYVGDPHKTAKDRLNGSLEVMRQNVARLLMTIPGDCKDLTLHDISHLDALWEMTTLIAGEDYNLNPAEAFVLGGAILLHDAGLTTAAFQGGLSEIKETVEWQDFAAGVLRQHGIDPTQELILFPSEE